MFFRFHRFGLPLLTKREACVAGEALLELKLAFNATAQRLTTWRPSDPNPCGWEGISCSLPDLRVQSMCVRRPICLLAAFLTLTPNAALFLPYASFLLRLHVPAKC
jgi:hypothetical protein